MVMKIKNFPKNNKKKCPPRETLKTSVLFYGFSYPHHMDEISSPFINFRSPIHISPPFLLIDESCTNTSSKLRLNQMQCMLFEI
jgi:hypothetical protein